MSAVSLRNRGVTTAGEMMRRPAGRPARASTSRATMAAMAHTHPGAYLASAQASTSSASSSPSST
jgi:hypothetical protein